MEFIAKKENLDIEGVMNVLNKKSGVQGMTGISSDFRDLEAAYNEGNEYAINAIEVFCYRVAKYIGSYVAAMNGVDAIAFTAGIGENTNLVRRKIVAYLGYLGITIDNLLSTFPSKPIMIIFTNRKTKQTVNTPPKILVRTLVLLLLFIVIKNFVNNKSWSALCFHINLSDVFAYNTDCKELKSSDCPN